MEALAWESRAVLHATAILMACTLILSCGTEEGTVGPDPTPVVGSVVVSPDSSDVWVGYDRVFSVAVRDTSGRNLSDVTVTWASSNRAIAEVDSTGRVTGVAQGTATITAATGSVSGSATARVILAPVRDVFVSFQDDTIEVGDSTVAFVTAINEMRDTVVDRDPVFFSADTSVATVDTLTGVIASADVGSVTIRASVDGKRGVAVLHVAARYTQVSAGFENTCAISARGLALCWGSPHASADQFGSDIPNVVALDMTFESVSVGHTEARSGGVHACGVATGGSAYCWGSRWDAMGGGLGVGEVSITPVSVLGGLSFTSLSAGSGPTCGILADSTTYCWGYDIYGLFGSGSQERSDVPVLAANGMHLGMISAGDVYTCGIGTDTLAYCWGSMWPYDVADVSSTPVVVDANQKFSSIAVAPDHVCALTPEGEAYCWGWGYRGRLGNGNEDGSATPIPTAQGYTFVSIGVGEQHSCGLKANGDAYCWGSNSGGQLGDGTSSFEFEDVSLVPVLVAGGHTFVSLSVGAYHTCGIEDGATLYCWGDNRRWRLGDGTPTSRNVPTRVFGQW
jgi:hypothetical protein